MTAAGLPAGAGVLVTGAQGFVGSWLVERLLAEGLRVIVLKRRAADESRFRREQLDGRCEQVDADLLDTDSLVRTVNEYDVQAVFHLAAQTIVGTANRSPFSTFEVNASGTYNLLEACRAVGGEGAPRVIVASSYHAYGEHGDEAISEEAGLRPSRPYDVSKACADVISRCYGATFGLPVAVVRMANVYGGGDLNFSRLVPDVARSLARGERPVIRSDGTPERDFLYVKDAVGAYLAVCASLSDVHAFGRAWNAGSGDPTSVLRVVQSLIEVSGRTIEPELTGDSGPRDEIDRQFLDSSAIDHELGWRPSHELSEGLRETYAWYSSNLSA